MQGNKIFLMDTQIGKYYFLGVDLSSGTEKAIIMLERNDNKKMCDKAVSTYKLTIRRSKSTVYVVNFGKRINIEKGLDELTNKFKITRTGKTPKYVVKCMCGGIVKSTSKDILVVESEYVDNNGVPLGKTTYKQVGEAVGQHYVCEKCGVTYHKKDLKYMKKEKVYIDDRNTSGS